MGGDNNRGWDLSTDGPSESGLPEGAVMYRVNPTGLDGDTVFRGYDPIDRTRYFHALGVFEPGSRLELYLDGQRSTAGDGAIPNQVADPDLPVNLGRKPSGTEYFQGILHKVRISRVARSAAYIRASHAAQTDPSFVRAGAVQSIPSIDCACPHQMSGGRMGT